MTPQINDLLRWSAAALSLLLSLAACARAPGAAELADFRSDGCSKFPDGTYYSCCYVHDVAYWPGGTAQEREDADKALRACVQEITGNRALAETMFLGVRAGGGPRADTSYRWGFGWPYPYRSDYAPLTAEERAQVAGKRQKLCRSLRLDPATGRVVVDVNREISAAQARHICPGL